MLPIARILFFLTGIFSIPLLLHSQSIELTYTVEQGTNNAPDTARVFAQSMSRQSIGIRAVNISLVFDGRESNLLGYTSYFKGPWTPVFERDRIDSIQRSYWGHPYQQRWNYGIGDALVNASSLVLIPPDTAKALMVFELYFQELGASLIYLEDQNENPVNQIGDSAFRQLPYQVRPLPGTFPVVWSGFLAKNIPDEGVLLQWETASELNNDFFVLEKSKIRDFNLFEEIGIVKGKGTSTALQGYTFHDTRAGSGQRYYRIKQVDIDGGYSYSNIINILVPPPAFRLQAYFLSSELLEVSILGIPESGVELSLQNTQGQILWKKTEENVLNRNLILSLPTNDFAEGVYFLRALPRDRSLKEQVKAIVFY